MFFSFCLQYFFFRELEESKRRRGGREGGYSAAEGDSDDEYPGEMGEEANIDDMLAWADDLDFDSYSKEWSAIGTTLSK